MDEEIDYAEILYGNQFKNNKQSEPVQYSSELEIDRYELELPLGVLEDPLIWWKDKQF